MAGRWTRMTDTGTTVKGARFTFLADAANGTIPDLEVDGVSGFILGIETVFDGTTPPHELTLVMKTANSVTQWSPTKLAASGFRKPETPEPVAGGFVLSATQTAAATNSATGTVTVFLG